MKDPRMLGVRLPPDVREWIEQEAGRRKMTMTDYVLKLIAKGIHAETIDDSVARLKEAATAATAVSAAVATESLRQVLVLRYMTEAQIKSTGTVRMPETLGTAAHTFAEKEMARLIKSIGGNHEH